MKLYDAVTGVGIHLGSAKKHLRIGRDTNSGFLHQTDWQSILFDRLGYLASDLEDGDNWVCNGPRANTTLQPWRAIMDAEGNARILVMHSQRESLYRPYYADTWTASDIQRLSWLVTSHGVRFGIVTNGEQWACIDAPEQTERSMIGWSKQHWDTYPSSWAAFTGLLHKRSVLGSDIIDQVFDDSARQQPDTILRIGSQVRRALGVFVSELAQHDRRLGGELLRAEDGSPLSTVQLRDGAVIWMVRALMLTSLESRGILSWGNLHGYSILHTYASLLERSRRGDPLLHQDTQSWWALRHAAHILYHGIEGQRPGYGGAMFDPATFLWLQDERAALSDAVVFVLLDALMRLPTQSEDLLVDFSLVTEEQVGQIYESLIDASIQVSAGTVLGFVGVQDSDVEVSDTELAAWQTHGDKYMVAQIAERTGKSTATLHEDMAIDRRLTSLQVSQATDHVPSVDLAMQWGGCLRLDVRGVPCVIAPGTPYLSVGVDRKQAGAHYTPSSMVSLLVRRTLEPLVYEQTDSGLRIVQPQDILRLRICDPAMGSGAFLVGACRYLADLLVASRLLHEGQVVHAASHSNARREVAEQCLSGVDINPIAVQLARMSLWLTTADDGRPFTFIDHNLRCGDSLLQVTLRELLYWSTARPHARESRRERCMNAGLEYKHYANPAGQERFDSQLLGNVILAVQRDLEHLAGMPSDTLVQVQKKEAMHKQCMARMQPVAVFADLLAATCIIEDVYERRLQAYPDDQKRSIRSSWPSKQRLSAEWCDLASQYFDSQDDAEQQRILAVAVRERDSFFGEARPFHWSLYTTPKHVFLGNPPFLGASSTSALLGSDWRKRQGDMWGWDSWTEQEVVATQADLAAFFVALAARWSLPKASIGYITTHSIGNGESSRVALEPLIGISPEDRRDWQVSSVMPHMKWPGEAAVQVALFTLVRGPWNGTPRISQSFGAEGTPVSQISASFGEPRRIAIKPKPLDVPDVFALSGDDVTTPFLLDAAQEAALLALEPHAKSLLWPALRGNDIAKSPSQIASKKAIRLPAAEYAAQTTYPHTFDLVKRAVGVVKRKDDWWVCRTRDEVTRASAGLDRMFVQAYTAKYIAPSPVDAGVCVVSPNIVIASDRYAAAMVVESGVHGVWVQELGTTLGATSWRYSTQAITSTFCFPDGWQDMPEWESLAAEYYTLRGKCMRAWNMGLTNVCNLIHSPNGVQPEIKRLRALREQFEQWLLEAYGWSDLGGKLGFQPTKSCVLFTHDATHRAEISARLMERNTAVRQQQAKNGVLRKPKNRKSNAVDRMRSEGQQDMWGE